MKKIWYVLAICMLFSCYNENKKQDLSPTDIMGEGWECSEEAYWKYFNSVKGHKEEGVIIGNFTGLGLDTIYVYEEIDSIDELGRPIVRSYYAKSNNPDVQKIELQGLWPFGDFDPPKLVYEGDVDGDGKDEWGYLFHGTNGQWRQYYILNYDEENHRWRYLYDGDLLSTPSHIRSSGLDIVEKGPNKGYIKINYDDGHVGKGIRDTIVAPTYTQISDDA